MDDDTACIERLASRRHAINSLEAADASDMLDYVDRARAAGERTGGVTAGRLERDAAYHELALARRCAVKTVQDAVCRARRVRGQLPTVWQAWLDGEVSTYEVSKIDSAAARLRLSTSHVELDRRVLPIAARKTVAQLAGWLDRFVERTEPDQTKRRHALAWKNRNVQVKQVGDGMASVTALIDSLSAAAIESRLDAEARSLPRTDERTHEQARTDVFRDLLLGPADRKTGVKYVVGITVPLSSMLGLSDQPGELSDRSASIPSWIIRQAMAEPGTLLYRLVTDDVGNLLTASWLGRFAPDELKHVVGFRDGTSAFPTSTVPAGRCDFDHSLAHPAPTEAANIGPLDRRAHALKTEGLLSMRQPRPGLFEWKTRTGHIYHHSGDPLPIAGWELEISPDLDIDIPPPPDTWRHSPDPLADTWDEQYRVA